MPENRKNDLPTLRSAALLDYLVPARASFRGARRIVSQDRLSGGRIHGIRSHLDTHADLKLISRGGLSLKGDFRAFRDLIGLHATRGIDRDGIGAYRLNGDVKGGGPGFRFIAFGLGMLNRQGTKSQGKD
jgi:hypothetical protein